MESRHPTATIVDALKRDFAAAMDQYNAANSALKKATLVGVNTTGRQLATRGNNWSTATNRTKAALVRLNTTAMELAIHGKSFC